LGGVRSEPDAPGAAARPGKLLALPLPGVIGMIICSVNGRPREVADGVQTWGQLLVSLESAPASQDAIVTAVRFHGVDEPSYREPSVLASNLRDVAPIEVETGVVRDLMASAIETVLEALEPLTMAARRTAEEFRRHDLPRGNRGLEEFVATFRALTQLTVAVGRLDRGSRTTGFSAEASAFLMRLHDSLESLITSNMNEDWISVADVLEYEIGEMLPDWAALLQLLDRDLVALRRAS
jgi:hypothetical protein